MTLSTSLPASVSRSASLGASTEILMKSLSQLTDINTSELPQKAHVVLEDQALTLVELRTVRGVRRIAPVDSAGSDDPDRRLVALHVPDLDRRCVSPEQQGVRVDVEAVHRVPRGMVLGDVERLEVVELVLHLGP